MFKLIALDIDGTLLDQNKAISEKTKTVIEALPNTIPVILISSRMPGAMRYLQKELNISDYPLVAYNGGLVLHQDKLLSQTGIETLTQGTILDQNKDLGLHLSFFHSDEWYAPQYDYWSQREIRNTKVNPVYKSNKEVFETWKSEEKQAHKIMCMGEEAKVEEMYNRLSKLENNALHLYRSKPTYIEMAPQKISKLTGLKIILDNIYPQLSFKDVIAYGDNYNDIEMLKNVGMGVAVANAKNEAKKVADEITQTNFEDGVANHLQKIFNL